MIYETPQVQDLGDLAELTLATGSLGTEDGLGKTITAQIDPLLRLSIGVLP